MTRKFDLIVIGTGAAASTVAFRCRKAGWSVAIIDSLPYGGTCALRGCDPKKVLVGAVEAVDRIRRLQGKGVKTEQANIDWADLMRFKRSFTHPVPQQREKSFKDEGLATFHGRAHFTGPQTIEVGGETLEGRRLHIATGARPADLKVSGQELLTLSDQFLELDHLPPRIIFVGGGYVSFEFAHVAVTAGAQVTILQKGERPLTGFDPDMVALLAKRTENMGIGLRVHTRVEALERQAKGLLVRATSASEPLTFEADMVVHGAGRVPQIDDLDLQTAGVEFGREGIQVNEFMQSVSNPNVYAAGDAAAGGLPLTPVAGFEARIAAANLLEGNRHRVEYPPIPSVVFTLPPLATVGLQESEASAQGLEFETRFSETSNWYSSRRIGQKFSGHKVLVERGTDRILGASLLGSHSEELINLFAIAIQRQMTSGEIKESMFAYPTLASDLSYMV